MQFVVTRFRAGAVLAGVLFFSGSFAIAGGLHQDGIRKVTGRWQCESAAGLAVLKISDDVFDFNGEQIPYTLVPGALRVRGPYGAVNYYYTFRKDVLHIAFPDGARISCTRTAADEGQATTLSTPAAAK
ncbi:MAG: hypothetical protein HY885_03920 [Deltaproteobacteria bacterium]|nr:hypothetical protein [Deltaproteobacteria bacterium]